MPIPEQFIDELVARSEISDVVSSYVHLTRKGNNLWGLCPFHNEKTPSFSVSPDKQIYHCFGCGKGGGVISFIMEIENLPFPDAVRLLAQRAGLEVPMTPGAKSGPGLLRPTGTRPGFTTTTSRAPAVRGCGTIWPSGRLRRAPPPASAWGRLRSSGTR